MVLFRSTSLRKALWISSSSSISFSTFFYSKMFFHNPRCLSEIKSFNYLFSGWLKSIFLIKVNIPLNSPREMNFSSCIVIRTASSRIFYFGIEKPLVIPLTASLKATKSPSELNDVTAEYLIKSKSSGPKVFKSSIEPD